MEFENVCKLNFNRSSDLVCLNFIYETNNAQQEPRRANYHAIGLVVDGCGVFNCDGHTHELTAGMLFFVEDGSRFSVASADGLKYYYISFYGRRGNEYLERLHIGGDNRVFGGYEELIPFWRDCQTLAEEGNIDIVCEAVLLYSLAKLRPDKKEQSDVVTDILMLTQKNFTNPDLSLASIAAKLGYDAKYLSSLFKKRRGVAYMQYLRELRIKHALFLMEQGVASVKNVALLSGFRDALYFSKVFAATEGVSPKVYIANLTQQSQKS